MADLLFISAHLPSPQAREAGQKTAFRNLEWLIEKYNIHLVAFRNELEGEYSLLPLKKVCSSIKVFDVDNSSRITRICRTPSLPLLVAARFYKKAELYLKHIVNENVFERVHCEYGQVAVYANAFTNIPIKTINLHDVITQWSLRRWKRCKNPVLKYAFMLEYIKSKQWERNAYLNFKTVYVPSLKDAQLLQTLSLEYSRNIRFLPPYFKISPSIGCHDANNRIVEAGSMLFWGAMNRKENEEAVIWFLKNIFPNIKQRVPHAMFYVVGNAPSQKLRRLAREDVIITGFVEDPHEYFRKAQIAVVPLLSGAGVKIKTLECLAAGLPVVATGIGAEGIDDTVNEGLISVRDGDAESFSNEVCKLLCAPDLCNNLGARGSEWIRKYFCIDPKVLLDVGH